MTYSEVENNFKNIVSEKNLTHAYLFESENQETLNKIENEIPKIIFCESNSACGQCKNCISIDNKNFYQLITIGNAEKRIKKQEVTELIFSLNTSSIGEDQRKVYVIKNAEHLGNESGNSLLKTLEEPPKGVTAILLTQSRHEVLSTIRSRCKLFFIDDEYIPLAENELVDAIKNKNKESLFLLSSKICKLEKSQIIEILKDATKKVILDEHLNLASDFYDAIYKIKKVNNHNLIVEELMIKLFEVM